MSQSQTELNPLLALSNQCADLVEQIGRSVVAVRIGRRDTTSGVMWRDGVLVTVAHPLRHARGLSLTLPDGADRAATLAGVDGTTDLAVLRTETASLPPVARADASDVRTGHFVFAVARGASGSLAVDHGLVGRTGPHWHTWRGGTIDRLIRLDGGLATGFSGAPIVDARGNAIGIGTAALARGVGVVVPTATVERVVDELLANGRIARGFLGVGAQPVELPPSLVQQLQLDSPQGLLIASIANDSPADKAGLLIGDILLELGSTRVGDIDDLYAALGSERIGSAVQAAVVRGGTRMEKSVTVGKRPRMQC